ncbi:MAG: transposase family protein [Gammaproteobacteria bacterium]|nr:transposase family protein [Gammaproteobacteria bacterium]
MTASQTVSILHHFSSIEDPRIKQAERKKHELPDIFFITLSTVISGADNGVTVDDSVKPKEDEFIEQFALPHGIPSHDSFGYIFATIDTGQFSECFSSWVADLAQLTEGR